MGAKASRWRRRLKHTNARSRCSSGSVFSAVASDQGDADARGRGHGSTDVEPDVSPTHYKPKHVFNESRSNTQIWIEGYEEVQVRPAGPQTPNTPHQRPDPILGPDQTQGFRTNQKPPGVTAAGPRMTTRGCSSKFWSVRSFL